jgi:hypothetical protein
VINTVQIDHIVVGPTGVFLIETKNWSEQSIQNHDLYSPVKQLIRHNFAVYTLLNSQSSHGDLSSLDIEWGRQKVSPKNLVVMIKHKPPQEFQHVNILCLPELVGYIRHGPVVFNQNQVEEMSNYLLQLCEPEDDEVVV